MQKILVSLPEDLVNRMKTTIPARQRSQVVEELLEFPALKGKPRTERFSGPVKPIAGKY